MLVLQDHVDKRRENNSFYRRALSSIEGILFQTEPTDLFHSNYWLTSILIDSNKNGGKTADDLRLALDAANIESRPLWKPMHLQPVFANCPSYVNGTSEKLFNMGLCIPSSSILSEEDLKRVARVMVDFFS